MPGSGETRSLLCLELPSERLSSEASPIDSRRSSLTTSFVAAGQGDEHDVVGLCLTWSVLGSEIDCPTRRQQLFASPDNVMTLLCRVPRLLM